MNRLTFLSFLILFVTGSACHKDDPPVPTPVSPIPPPPVVHLSSLITTDSSSILLQLDSTFQLTMTIQPSNTTNPKLKYSSSDTSILKVDSMGRLTGTALGTATITVTSVDNPALTVTIHVAVVRNYAVYIAGYGPDGYAHEAMIWSNGVYSVLTPGDLPGGYNASALAFAGSDIYVAGETIDANGNTDGCCWKNGNQTIINYPPPTDGNTITSMALSGPRTYLAGYVLRRISNPSWDPTYVNEPVWNGSYYTIDGNTINRTLLETDTNDLLSLAYSMAISGSDVYVAGAFQAGNGNRIATYWKNDLNGAVPLAAGGDWSEAAGIALQGGNVYVAGYEQCPNEGCIPTVKLWMNDMHTVTNLTGGTDTALPSCLAITDTAQFVGGYQQTPAGIKQAMLWRVKGNTVVSIPLSDGLTDAMVNGIAVSGNDIFLAGYQVDPAWNNRVATYWRVYGDFVSRPMKLPTGRNNGAFTNSEANAILVK